MAKTILIIDDEEAVLDVLARFFVMKGLRTLTAKNTEAARELVGECDLVLSDVRIGDDHGLEFLEEIRRRKCGIPFLFMSGMLIDAESEKAMELTGYPVLFKPDITRIVYQIVETILV